MLGFLRVMLEMFSIIGGRSKRRGFGVGEQWNTDQESSRLERRLVMNLLARSCSI